MRSPSRRALPILVALLALAANAHAQDKAADVFDAEPAKPDDKGAKPAPADPTKPATPAPGGAADRDSIGFTQQNVASQMAELEGRMFRLSEALRSLEPENAARLSLALKFSREELIYQQMKEAQGLLKEAQLAKAETEARELLAKLEHLRSLLLAEDLDFQMKLARLRQMRETLARLDRIVKEERRELAWSRESVDKQKGLEPLKSRLTELDALIRDQKAILDETRDVSAKPEGDERTKLRNALANRETQVRKSAATLAANPAFDKREPPYLKQADPLLGDASTYLGTPDIASAVAPEEKTLALFQAERDRLNEQVASDETAVAEGEFRKFEKDQARNRGEAATLAEASARLGDSGVALQKDLIRAGGAMEGAEGELARTKPVPASGQQLEALKHLTKSRADLAKATEGQLVGLRAELQSRLVAELTEMHEIQAAIRETTEAQAPRVLQKSRTALVVVAGLSQKEAELAERTNILLALVEELEYGLALPTALRVLSRQMTVIQGWLKDGDASERTVTLEKRVEVDLLALVEALRRLPPTTPPKNGEIPPPSDPRSRERELNRLIAELKMIRLLQSRLNDDTLGVDKGRPQEPTLPAALRREIEALKSSQEELRDTIKSLSDRYENPGGGNKPTSAPDSTSVPTHRPFPIRRIS